MLYTFTTTTGNVVLNVQGQGSTASGLAGTFELTIDQPPLTANINNGATFSLGARVSGEFGGKVECSEYLIGPYRSGEFRVVIPGMGDRIFSMTQDDEMVVAFPGKFLEGLLVGLKEAAKKIGARYPITFYQNFSPSFPPAYEERARKWGIL